MNNNSFKTVPKETNYCWWYLLLLSLVWELRMCCQINQGICFLGTKKFRRLLLHHLKRMAAKNVDVSANLYRCISDFAWALKRIFKKQNWLSFHKSSYRRTREVCRAREKRSRVLSKYTHSWSMKQFNVYSTQAQNIVWKQFIAVID